jgi:anti-sigma factor (TIGR02949 family)
MSQFTPYTCAEAFRRLDDYLDRELSAEEMAMVRAHLETCAVCAREFGYEASALGTIREKLQQIDLPEDLKARVAAVLAQERGG